jgi:hypothetical protein
MAKHGPSEQQSPHYVSLTVFLNLGIPTPHPRPEPPRTTPTPSSRLTFTTALHAKLPRELRDMIYQRLFDVVDPFDFLGFTDAVRPRIDDSISYWPRKVMSGTVSTAFEHELVELFYENYTEFAVQDVRGIEGFLDADHFDMGLRLSEYRLPALATCIALFGDYSLKKNHKGENNILPACIDPRKAQVVKPKDMAACFAPLVRE